MSNALSIDMFKPFQSGSLQGPSLSPSSGLLDVAAAAAAVGVPGGNRSIDLAHCQSCRHPRPPRRNCAHSPVARRSSCLVCATANAAAGRLDAGRHGTGQS